MNSKGHFFVSLTKSIIRICACFWAMATYNIIPLAAGFLAAEALGIVEELCDKR